ncbi:hypothetical protein JCM21900_003144 [Sporobolomyces salmonicolor]
MVASPPAPASPSATTSTRRNSHGSNLNPRAAPFHLKLSASPSAASKEGNERGNGSNGSGSSSGEPRGSDRLRGHRDPQDPPVVAPSAVTLVSASSHHPSVLPYFTRTDSSQHLSPSANGSGSSSPSTSSLLVSPTERGAVIHTPPPDPVSSISSSSSSLSSTYSLLPLRTFRKLHLLVFTLTFLLLFLLPVTLLILYKHELRPWPFLLGVASWLAGETLREVVFELCTPGQGQGRQGREIELEDDGGEGREVVVRLRRRKSTALPTVVHAIAQETLRLGAIALAVALLPDSPEVGIPELALLKVGIPELALFKVGDPRYPRAPLPRVDPLLFDAVWLSLGWAGAEILWSSRTFWKQMELYADVLPSDDEFDDEARLGVLEAEGEDDDETSSIVDGRSHHHYGATERGHLSEEDEQEDEFEARMRALQREEIEDQLGVPLYEIPAGIVFIWKFCSILLSLVFTLFLSLPFRTTSPTLIAFPLWPTFFLVALTHALLSWLWQSRVRSMGIPSVSYASLVVLVGLTFAALASWGVLV